jgi:hypothetical protein
VYRTVVQFKESLITAIGYIEVIEKKEKFVFHIKGWCVIEKHHSLQSSIFMCLSDDRTSHYFNLPGVMRYDVNSYLNDEFNYCNSGFDAFISTYGIPPGIYNVSFYIKHANGTDYLGFFASGATVEIN